MMAVFVENNRRRFHRFVAGQDGAVTVDWVVLTALVVGLAAAALTSTEEGIAALTAKLASYLMSLIV